jgi:hypothetical protein
VATTNQKEYVAFCLFLTSDANPHRNLIPLMLRVTLSLRLLARADEQRGVTQELLGLQRSARELVQAVGRAPVRSCMPKTMYDLANAPSNASLATRIAQEVGPVIRTFPNPQMSVT